MVYFTQSVTLSSLELSSLLLDLMHHKSIFSLKFPFRTLYAIIFDCLFLNVVISVIFYRT